MLLKELIGQYVEDNRISYRAFAKKCGLSPAYLSMITTGNNPSTGKPPVVSYQKLLKIAAGMDMSIHQLMQEVDDMPVDISTGEPEAQENELWELREELRRNPDMRMLFSASKGAKKEHIQAAAAMLNALKGNDDCME